MLQISSRAGSRPNPGSRRPWDFLSRSPARGIPLLHNILSTVLDRYFRRQPSHRLELPLSFRKTCLSANSKIAATCSDSHAPVILSAYWPDNSPRVSTPQVCYAFYVTAVGLVPGSWPLARFWDRGAGMAWHVSTAGEPGTGRPHSDTRTACSAPIVL